jgi:hypothetical protein
MTKYILKKDLPFAKAGAEVIFESGIVFNSISQDRFMVKVDDTIGQYSYRFIGYVAEIERLIKEGWIEEVKEPRMIEIHYDKEGRITGFYELRDNMRFGKIPFSTQQTFITKRWKEIIE